MGLGQLLFSFRGRINRAKYWLAALVIFGILVVAIGIGATAAVAGNYSSPLLLLIFPVVLLALFSGLAVGAKRLHDREKSAWWLLPFYLVPGVLQGVADSLKDIRGEDMVSLVLALALYLVALALSVWAFVELGCLRGTVGANRYGPDPLEGRG